jgi:hypothetical protein
MAKRGMVLAAGVLAPLAALTVFSLARVNGDDPAAGPVFKHGLELRVRHAGEADFSEKTKKVGVEFFLDGPNGNGVYVGEAGDLAALAAKLVQPETPPVKAPDWSHGMELRARHAGEKEFTKETKRYGIEVFVDANNGNYVYVCETGAMAVVPGKVGAPKPGKDVKAPEWKNAMELRVRKAGEPDFNDKTKKIGVEVFQDANNGNVVYISETGSIAVLPQKLAKTPFDTTKLVPDWKHGMELAARRADEKEFSKDTKRYGVEVFFDAFAGGVLYVGENGNLAVVPASLSNLPEAGAKVKGPEWKRAMVLACRKAGEADFTPQTKRYGVEVFLDPNTGNTVYISETGALTVVSAKDPG